MEKRIRELTRSSNGMVLSGGPWCPIVMCYLALGWGAPTGQACSKEMPEQLQIIAEDPESL